MQEWQKHRKTLHLKISRDSTKIKKPQSFDLNYFIGKNYFHYDRLQNYLIFQLVFKYLQIFDSTISFELKSKRLPEEVITTPTTSDTTFAPKLTYTNKFNNSFLN